MHHHPLHALLQRQRAAGAVLARPDHAHHHLTRLGEPRVEEDIAAILDDARTNAPAVKDPCTAQQDMC